MYQAILNDKSEERIARIVDYYDYLEVQPLGNNKFMIGSDRITKVNSEEDLREINRKIIKLGENLISRLLLPVMCIFWIRRMRSTVGLS